MDNEIGPVVLGSLSTLFACYGVRELAIAYKEAAFRAWSEKAVPGAASLWVGGLFAVMTFQILN